MTKRFPPYRSTGLRSPQR
ncbi:MAG: hypothetical protein LBJ91_03550 [Clostridiales Family XIII bacterium]|nr:hypothetical protein [Clostridiales Family XIII bacterium]